MVRLRRIAPLARDSHLILEIKVQHRPPVNAHPPQADCAFPFGLTLDEYLNLSKIRYVIRLRRTLEPDLEF